MEDVQTVILRNVTNPRSRLKQVLSGVVSAAPLIDIGTTSLTGISGAAFAQTSRRGLTTNPVFSTVPLDPKVCLKLGSHFVRTGLLFDPPDTIDGEWTDQFGVRWLIREGTISPLRHPLEHAGPEEAVRLPIPEWGQPVRMVDDEIAENSVVIADAPCAGLLDLCFMMRGPWQFLEDVAEGRRTVSDLLEWSMETIVQAYAYMLRALPEDPDVIVYGDDLGFGDTMFLSPSDFRDYLLPRLKTLVARLRDLTTAAICFHGCGALGPILSDIVDLGVEIVNLDTGAKGMAVPQLRRTVPNSVVLHAATDLCALGAAVAAGNKAAVASLITELAGSAPAIAGPTDSLASMGEVLDAARGAAFIRNLSDEDFDCLATIGPVRGIIESALEKALADPPPDAELGPSLRESREATGLSHTGRSGRRCGQEEAIHEIKRQ